MWEEAFKETDRPLSSPGNSIPTFLGRCAIHLLALRDGHINSPKQPDRNIQSYAKMTLWKESKDDDICISSSAVVYHAWSRVRGGVASLLVLGVLV